MKKAELPHTGKRAFLAAYSKSGNITQAAKAAKVPRSMHYKWLEGDGKYAVLFTEAHERACDSLEEEARRRACDGIDDVLTHQGRICYHPEIDPQTKKPKLNEHGHIILSDRPIIVKKYSDRLLEQLLKAHRPDKYRDNFKGEIPGFKPQWPDLSRATDEDLEELEAIARRLQSRAA